jgi:AcrR family transcriptional regulator
MILEAAARLATVEGLEGLSLGRLADHIGMSKSGLFAHFGSKEELQLATVETAVELFNDAVVYPAIAVVEPLDRLDALCSGFIEYLRARVFPGGCFFAAAIAEFDTHPGPVHDRVRESQRGWMQMLEDLVDDAKARGEVRQDEDSAQVAFEIDAALLMANMVFVLYNDEKALDRGLLMIRNRIQALRESAKS